MSNNKSNSNNVKTKLTVMVAAIASVLLAGMGMNSAAYASILDNGFPGFNVDDIGQSAECVGVAIECRENSDNIKVKNNNNNNGNAGNGTNGNGGNGPIGPIDPTACEACIADLTEDQQNALFAALQVSTIAEVCLAIEELSVVALVTILSDNVGLSATAIVELLACLGIDITLAEVLAIIAL